MEYSVHKHNVDEQYLGRMYPSFIEAVEHKDDVFVDFVLNNKLSIYPTHDVFAACFRAIDSNDFKLFNKIIKSFNKEYLKELYTEVVDINGNTLLNHVSVFKTDLNTYQIVIPIIHDIDKDLIDFEGIGKRTPLIMFVYAHSGIISPEISKIVELFIQYGGNVNAVDYIGANALFYATHAFNYEIISTLLSHGADSSAVTKTNQSVVDPFYIVLLNYISSQRREVIKEDFFKSLELFMKYNKINLDWIYMDADQPVSLLELAKKAKVDKLNKLLSEYGR
jgi:ankyrin repeat protein